MNKQTKHQQYIARERALYIYLCAFERGDFEAMDHVLQQAEDDPILEALILEVHDDYLAEEQVRVHTAEWEKVHALVLEYLAAGIWEEEEDIGIPLVTVGEVVRKLQQERNVSVPTRTELTQLGQQLSSSDVPLPDALTMPNLAGFFEQLGVRVSSRLQKAFRDTAIIVSMGRQQGMAQLAATRRQQQRKLKQEKERNE